MGKNIDEEPVIKKIKQALERTGQPIRCPFCGHSHLNVEDAFVVQQVHRDPKKLEPVSSIIPLVPVSCPNCGLMLNFSSVQLGLMEGENPNG